MPHWTKRFMRMACSVAGWSKDPSTKVGAVAVDKANRVRETGFNGLPRGVADNQERMERPVKYLWTTHAEANLIAHAARSALEGTTVYVTHYPCAQCAALLINAGVARVVVGEGITSMPMEHFEVSRQMFTEAGVVVEMERDNDVT